MTSRGRILLADDEDTFLQSTADLLRREGYECDPVPDGIAALARAQAHPYDVLISDLEMPGNQDLALVRQVSETVGGLPIIIITGFPSTRSAIAAIDLPVAAYLLKPVNFVDLLSRVQDAVARYRTFQAMRQTEERLKSWQRELTELPPRLATGIDGFLALTLRNVMGSLTDLQHLGNALATASATAPTQHACSILNCPRGSQLQQAIRDTIGVLEETKSAFKSKALGDLRRRLELLLEHN